MTGQTGEAEEVGSEIMGCSQAPGIAQEMQKFRSWDLLNNRVKRSPGGNLAVSRGWVSFSEQGGRRASRLILCIVIAELCLLIFQLNVTLISEHATPLSLVYQVDRGH